jgi:hypothetical protein
MLIPLIFIASLKDEQIGIHFITSTAQFQDFLDNSHKQACIADNHGEIQVKRPGF